jgi:alkylhydroperoxidase/carboxymuconolactone decarboxylase family protein YurZ
MLALAPTIDEQFTTCANTALTGAILSDRERALAVLTTVCVLGDNGLIEQAVVCAKEMGITNAEIGQTHAIVLAVQGVFKHYCLPC